MYNKLNDTPEMLLFTVTISSEIRENRQRSDSFSDNVRGDTGFLVSEESLANPRVIIIIGYKQ